MCHVRAHGRAAHETVQTQTRQSPLLETEHVPRECPRVSIAHETGSANVTAARSAGRGRGSCLWGRQRRSPSAERLPLACWVWSRRRDDGDGHRLCMAPGCAWRCACCTWRYEWRRRAVGSCLVHVAPVRCTSRVIVAAGSSGGNGGASARSLCCGELPTRMGVVVGRHTARTSKGQARVVLTRLAVNALRAVAHGRRS